MEPRSLYKSETEVPKTFLNRMSVGNNMGGKADSASKAANMLQTDHKTEYYRRESIIVIK